MATLYLVRHGETEWNRIGRWQGHIDVPLSERGRQQAQALARRLKRDNAHFNKLYASDLRRAFETAQVIAQALHMPIHLLPDLREINLGAWSGLTRNEIIERFPGALVTIHHAPDGETHEVFATRVWNVLTQLTQQHQSRTLLVVTHGGAIRAMLRRLYTLMGQSDQPVPPIDNTSITEIQLRDGCWSILRINDAAHLHSVKVPDAVTPRDEGNLLG